MKIFMAIYILLFLALLLLGCSTDYIRREIDVDCSKREYICTKKYFKPDVCHNYFSMTHDNGQMCEPKIEVD